MRRSVVLAASRSSRLGGLLGSGPAGRGLVRRFVAGVTAGDAVRAVRELAGDGVLATVSQLGEDARDRTAADAARDGYRRLLAALADAGLASAADLSVRLGALGQGFDERLAFDRVSEVCGYAAEAGASVTLDMADRASTDSTYDTAGKLREEFPSTGVTLQSYLRRTEADCRDLAGTGARVRICKGGYVEPESVAYQSGLDVDRSYVRCLNILLAGDGYPMVATHDPRLIAIAQDRAAWYGREPERFEFQLYYGVRPYEQRRLAELGYRVRAYVPYGRQWQGYLARRLAERPANLALLARAATSGR